MAESRIARPRTFDLPAYAGRRATIAIRGWVHAALGQTEWRSTSDTGPYVLTDLANASRTAGAAHFDRLRTQTTLNLVSSTVLLLLALIILLIAARQRRIGLLWLAIFDAGVAYRWLQVGLLTSPDATGWASFFLMGPSTAPSSCPF